MPKTSEFTRRYVALPAATGLLILSAAAVVNAVAPSDMIATDGRVEIIDDRYTQELVREMGFAPGRTLRVASGNGRIAVSSWDQDKLQIKAMKKMERRVGGVGWVMSKLNIPFKTSEDVETFFQEVTVDVRAVENGIEVETIVPSPKPNVNVSIDYEILLPRKANLALRTSNGRVSVNGIEGTIETRTSNGRIEITQTTGAVQAHTSNGPVVLTSVSGPVRAETSNGSVSLERSTPLTASDSVYCKTSNGSIKVRIPRDSAFVLDARTSNGAVRSEFDVSGQEERDSKRRLAGKVGPGGPLVELRTSNGSISLSAN